jgi:hypothetical protein
MSRPFLRDIDREPDLIPTASRNRLSNIPLPCIVEAMGSLPPCGTQSASEQVQIDVPRWGRFLVTFSPFRQSLRGWRTRWFWIALHADPVASSSRRRNLSGSTGPQHDRNSL